MRQKLIVEKRTSDGKLDFSAPQPPFFETDEGRLANYYYQKSGDQSYSVDLKTIYGWYNAQGFHIRPKTW